MNQQKPGREMPTGALRLAVQSPEEAHLSHLHDRVLAALRPAGLPLPPPPPPTVGLPPPGRGESGGQTQPHRSNRAVTVPAHGACLGAAGPARLPT